MSKFSGDLIESLTEAVAHASGEKTGVRMQTVETPDVRVIRRQHDTREVCRDLSHSSFDPQNWEQGHRLSCLPSMQSTGAPRPWPSILSLLFETTHNRS